MPAQHGDGQTNAGAEQSANRNRSSRASVLGPSDRRLSSLSVTPSRPSLPVLNASASNTSSPGLAWNRHAVSNDRHGSRRDLMLAGRGWRWLTGRRRGPKHNDRERHGAATKEDHVECSTVLGVRQNSASERLLYYAPDAARSFLLNGQWVGHPRQLTAWCIRNATCRACSRNSRS